jgi:hypothetical protein
MRAQLWPAESSDAFAVGYRFKIPGRWADPDESLQEESAHTVAPPSGNPEITTQFTNSAGRGCGEYRVKFLKSQSAIGPGQLYYLVDNSDLRGLLRTIGICAAQGIEMK